MSSPGHDGSEETPLLDNSAATAGQESRKGYSIRRYFDAPTFCTLSAIFAFITCYIPSSATAVILLLTVVLVETSFSVPRGDYIKSAIMFLSMTLAAFVGHIVPAHSALPSASGFTYLVLFGFSALFSALFLVISLFDHYVCRFLRPVRINQLILFPTLWCMSIEIIARFNPMGRLMVPSPVVGLDGYGWLLRLFGPLSLDWITAAWAASLAHPAKRLYMGTAGQHSSFRHTSSPVTNDSQLIIDYGATQDNSGSQQTNRKPRQISDLSLLAIFVSFLLALLVPSVFIDNSILRAYSSDNTPLSVGCVLPTYRRYKHSPLRFDDYLQETRVMQSRAKLLLWPEGAVTFNSAAERDEAFSRVSLAAQGHVGVSFEEKVDVTEGYEGKTLHRNGIAIISNDTSEPVHMVYYKRHLVPVAESYSMDPGDVPPSTYDVKLIPPHSYPRSLRHPRNITLSASICLDFAFSNQFSSLASRPSVVLAPARTWDKQVGQEMWQQALMRSKELGSSILWCDGGDEGLSGVAGNGFSEPIHRGEGSWVTTIGLPFPSTKAPTFATGYKGQLVFVILAWIAVGLPAALRGLRFLFAARFQEFFSAIPFLRKSSKGDDAESRQEDVDDLIQV